MPISCNIDLERDLVLTTATGILTDEDVLQVKARLRQDPDFRPGMKELSDIRSIERLAVTAAGVRTMVQEDRGARAHAPHRLALVLSTDAAFGMARMYQMMSELTAPNVGVFKDLDEAHTWLQSDVQSTDSPKTEA